MRTKVIVEIGINHNGDIDLALKMIKAAKACGGDYVKFQKRSVEIVYAPEELAAPRQHPFGTTNGDLKRHLEFGLEQYQEIDKLCKTIGIEWFGSPWDLGSLEFLLKFNPPYIKIASPCNLDAELLLKASKSGVPLIISTGMTEMDEIFKIVRYVEDNKGKIACLMHCTSTYPAKLEEINLLGVAELKKNFPHIPIGYSGHETIVPTTIMAMALGAEFVERHFTLDRTMFGSDQAASLEPAGLEKICTAARAWDRAKGDGRITKFASEEPVETKLRRVRTL